MYIVWKEIKKKVTKFPPMIVITGPRVPDPQRALHRFGEYLSYNGTEWKHGEYSDVLHMASSGYELISPFDSIEKAYHYTKANLCPQVTKTQV